ncbi:DNA-3-methyladenine glycosylase [Geosporobacter ferrireducens]|uniref:DNA-3-methyladenine glycosylase n=1 Tax=Geosporobacter ferrireducens TaxID=1424294 RepID=UPI00139CE2C0|nr:DNA-3-methyladenine glycosylase [Geosporobacter ferrireducens]MTI54610.1 DNA-3-methyladenine glycosylase [Geosporobacter ferrireducens]
MEKLKREFFEGNTLNVAKELLGKILIHRIAGVELAGRIVEAEAYIGAVDKAAHSYNNRRTARTEIMFGPAGYAYIYLIYGMYYCMNVVTGKAGEASAVLIRALEPFYGMQQMAFRRYNKPLEELTKNQRIHLTNGPGKLCAALGIDKNCYGEDLLGERLFICREISEAPFEIETSKRINIDYAEEARDFLWRFYIKNNAYVSRK